MSDFSRPLFRGFRYACILHLGLGISFDPVNEAVFPSRPVKRD